MERQPGIKRVTPVLVHVLDEFAFDGVQVAHRFDPFDERRVFAHPSDLPKDEAPGLRGGYLRIEHDDGEVRFHFVAVSKIEAARKCSQTPDLDRQGRGGVWRKWYAEQATKTVLRDAWARRAVAVEPILSERMGEVVQRDDAALGNDPLRIEVAPRDAEPPEERAPSAAPANKGAAKLRDALRPATIDTTAEPVAEVAP
jgi:recombinational DNA repair protein RecT